MTDEQIEALLQRYELRAPDDGLKERILTAAETAPSVTLAAGDYRLLLAAAVLILAVVLSDPDAPGTPTSAIEAAWRAEVEAAAEAIGGDQQALKLAEMLVPRPESLDLEEETW
jgi:hypothetical protein